MYSIGMDCWDCGWHRRHAKNCVLRWTQSASCGFTPDYVTTGFLSRFSPGGRHIHMVAAATQSNSDTPVAYGATGITMAPSSLPSLYRSGATSDIVSPGVLLGSVVRAVAIMVWSCFRVLHLWLESGQLNGLQHSVCALRAEETRLLSSSVDWKSPRRTWADFLSCALPIQIGLRSFALAQSLIGQRRRMSKCPLSLR